MIDKSFSGLYKICCDVVVRNFYLVDIATKRGVYESKNNTTGPKSIGKQELIKEFNMFT